MTRPDRSLAFLLFALTLGLYLRMLAPDLLPGDPGEFQFAAWRWGLAHPTGYPLYLLLGGAWQRLLNVFNIGPALALNAFSALTGALTGALLYLLMRNWLPGAEPLRRIAALFSTALFAVNPTFWSQNLIAEVYALYGLLLVLIFLVLGQGAGETGKQRDRAHSAFLPRQLVLLSCLLGLALAHHAMTLLLLPSLVATVILLKRDLWRSPSTLLAMAVAGGLPLLLYFYIPLRSGPEASPWYHQRLGDGILTLYEGDWPAFWRFISGQSIAVGFYDLPQAWANLSQAWRLWQIHFTWVGLALALVGLASLLRQRRWPILTLTLGYFILQQGFNLCYAIGDILVYYIPLYLIAAIWAGFGILEFGMWISDFGVRNVEIASSPLAPRSSPLALFFILLCFLLPLWLWRTYYPRLDQSTATAAREMWTEILAAQPPADAILVSNDRNEIVPLFYLQAVEGQATGITGLFPLIKPGADFADIGATVETALHEGGDQAVYLIKPMPGLEARFDLAAATPPLMRVLGSAAERIPMYPLDEWLGSLHLVGYDWQPLTDTVQVDLHWRVDASLPADYTTTVQLFDGAGEKIAQDDQPAGGVYYPTSLWKPGETLIDRHTVALPPDRSPVTMLVSMYTGSDFSPLATPLNIQLSSD